MNDSSDHIYPRSFDRDLAGITARLDHLAGLGVDAIWLTPFQRSPQADHGYDVSDYCDVDPLFGDLAGVRPRCWRGAHARGLRVIVDLVPNHCSAEHPLFRAALAAGPGSPDRARFHFARAAGGRRRPPNNWPSVFGGPAWTRSPSRTAAGGVVPAPVRPGAAGLELARPGARRRSSTRCCGSGSTAGWTGCASTSRTGCSRPTACPIWTRPRRCRPVRLRGNPLACDQDGGARGLPALARAGRDATRRRGR